MIRALWNPWHGCKKYSEGCANCYVYYLDGIREKDASVITRSKSNFDLPIKRTKSGNYKIQPNSEVATCFTSDFFIKEADEWRDEAWSVIKKRPDVKFLICTKRISRFKDCIPADWNNGYDNVKIAVSCETQKRADERLPILLDSPAKYKCIFLAPLLENIALDEYLKTGDIQLVSVGGESYKNARPCDFEWIKNIKRCCNKYNTPFELHQTGSNFVMNGKEYRIKHRDEYSQARKAMTILNDL